MVLSVLNLDAQDYFDFDSVAVYNTATGGIVHNQGQTYTYQNGHTQFIEKVESYGSNEVQYYYLYDSGDGVSLNNVTEYELFLYVDSVDNILKGSPFIYGTDAEVSHSSFEFYNYNLQVGDTVHSVLFQSNGTPDFYVSDIDSALVNGVNRRVFTYTKFGGNGTLDIFQGIGSEQGFLPGDYSFGEIGQWLECVFFDNKSESDFGNCFVTVEENLLNVKAFPNPFQDNFLIEFSKHFKGIISVVDLQGKIYYQEPINRMSFELYLSFLKSGTYILCITDNDGGYISRYKIVKY
jgi:hypothetical protein